MSLRIRRGTDSQRTGITFDLGELVWTTDTQKLYVGDGITAGGINAMANLAGVGFTFNPTTQKIDFSLPNLNLNTSEVAENSANLYFTDTRAQAAAAAALLAGNAYNTGIAFSWDSVDGRITAVATGNQVPSITGNAGKYLTTDGTNIIWHNPPIPGGLSIPSFDGNQGKYLTTDGTNLAWANISINTLSYTTAGNVTYNANLTDTGFTIPVNIKLAAGTDIKRDNGSGTFVSVLGGLDSVSSDLTPSLGGNLGLGGYNISGSGNIDITGYLHATGTLQTGSATITGTLGVTTGLGRDLSLNGFNIIGSTGSINISGSITGGTITGTSLVSGNLSLSTNSITVTSGTLYVQNNSQQIIQFRGVNANGSPATAPQFNLFSSRGNIGSPTNSQPGDALLSLNFGGYNSGNYQQAASIIVQYDPIANMSDTNPAANLVFVTNNNNGGQNLAYLDKHGVFNAPVFLATSYTNTNMLAIASPTAGMIVFNSTYNHFYGYNGSNWVAFTGP
jgi:hypothetical protein